MNKEASTETKPKITPLTKLDFDKTIITSEKPVLVQFASDHCAPCHQAEAVIEQELADKFGDRILIYKVDTFANFELAQAHKITGVPTFLVWEPQANPDKPVSRWTGFRGKQELEDNITKALEEINKPKP